MSGSRGLFAPRGRESPPDCAIDTRAAKFYAAHGFQQLPESMRLILPMQTIAAMIEP
jgi:hypothetical protein